MSRKIRKVMVRAAACVEPPPAPWKRRSRRGATVIVVVVQVLNAVRGGVDWHDPLDSTLTVAIAVMGIELLYNAVRAALQRLGELMPDKLVLTRRNGRLQTQFG
ncbi:hypothetical protein [Streptomyces griseofuscus]|uniref:hypothetical protein n=1 Tax=Streptomyces griseofuscus TaxID=146922 RepID=UPI0033F1D886